MAHADQSRFKSTIIGPSFARAPESLPVEPVPEPAAAHAVPPQTALPQTTVILRKDEMRQGPLAVRSAGSHSMVIEAVTLPRKLDPRLVMLDGSATRQARAFRLLRHRLLSLGDPRIIAISSAEPGEGKTTCAANLAFALADETFARVLLIEANLRRPAFGPLFGYTPAPTFMDRLVQHRDATPPYPVAGVAGTRLHLAALPPAGSPAARLDRLLLGVVLQDLRSAYDYIVIDSAAVLESADAEVVGGCSDGVLLVARTKHSRASALHRAMAELSPSKVMGSVLLDA
ncbi:MAG TPA: CpsD/CapB family tyrosine-protein kinase [Polyangiaceae bacterium]